MENPEETGIAFLDTKSISQETFDQMEVDSVMSFAESNISTRSTRKGQSDKIYKQIGFDGTDGNAILIASNKWSRYQSYETAQGKS